MSIKTNTTNLQNLLSIAQSLPEAGGGGITPSGTLNITENGTHNVANYASANVNVPQLDTSSATATASDILSGKTAYAKGSKVTGNIETVTQPNPTVSIDYLSGLITASYTPKKGYTGETNKKEISMQLTVQSEQTITPSTSDKTISSGTYLTGVQTIKGDRNLIASNIKSGVSIFGVDGSLVEGITPSGTLQITENGTYNVTNYASAVVEVQSQSIDEYCNVNLSFPGGTTMIGHVNGTLISEFKNGDFNQTISVKKGSFLTLIDESSYGIQLISVTDGINWLGKGKGGKDNNYLFFATFEITSDCRIYLAA